MGGRQAVGIPQSSGDASQPRPPRPFAALRPALDRAAALASSGRPPSLRPRPRGHSAPNSTASALRRSGPVAATGSLRKAGQVAGASGLQRRAGTAASGFPAPAARSQGPWKHLLPLQQRSAALLKSFIRLGGGGPRLEQFRREISFVYGGEGRGGNVCFDEV